MLQQSQREIQRRKKKRCKRFENVWVLHAAPQWAKANLEYPRVAPASQKLLTDLTESE